MEATNILSDDPPTAVCSHRTYGTRTLPMRVLCLGLGRTGTQSLRDQLVTLGFNHTYHTFDAVHRDPYDCKLWMDLLVAKFDHGLKPSRADLDKLLGHCQAVIDMPAAAFAEELIEYYPDAKVILTVRDPDAWARSHRNSLLKARGGPLARLLTHSAVLLRMPDRWTHPMFLKLQRVLYDDDFARNGVPRLRRQHELVRSLVPADRLLEYHVGDGWAPLCAFLGREPPPEAAVAVPHVNDADAWMRRHENRLRGMLRAQLRRVLDLAAYAALAWLLVSQVRAGLGRLEGAV